MNRQTGEQAGMYAREPWHLSLASVLIVYASINYAACNLFDICINILFVCIHNFFLLISIRICFDVVLGSLFLYNFLRLFDKTLPELEKNCTW